jgi:murein DD-endopeptidase MepM/ murein hydrolase activator NlpD
VDYSAHSGTPIRAPADGVIQYAGWKGDYGRYLSLRHNSTYTTTYGHLSRYGPGIRRGARVKQGQVIGYVGSSGLATGPHLCYRILRNGKSLDPLKFRGSAGPGASNLKDFRTAKSRLQAKLASAQALPGAASTQLAQEAGD